MGSSFFTKRGEGDPEEPVASAPGRSRSLAFEDGDMLPESEYFQRSIGPGPDENTEGDQHSNKELKHEPRL